MLKKNIFIGLFFPPLISMAMSMTSTLDQWRTSTNTVGATLILSSPTVKESLVSGSAQIKNGTPITMNTLFAIGSITKTFISAEILLLEADGKLSIDDPIGPYFPQYPRWANITIKQLLNMQSGITNFTESPIWLNAETNPKTAWTGDQLILLAYHQPDRFQPSKGWYYSNTDYQLLGKIIEQKTHQSLEDVLVAKFFKPLHLNHTYFSEMAYPQAVMKQMAHGYYNSVDMSTTRLSNFGAAGGGMLMSTEDLKNWINHLFVKQDILPKKQWAEMLMTVPTDDTPDRPADSRYGLGVFTAPDANQHQMIWYTGVVSGYSSTFIWIPDTKQLVISQANVQRINDVDYNLLFPNKTLMSDTMKFLQKPPVSGYLSLLAVEKTIKGA